jgi:hypothetical protein
LENVTRKSKKILKIQIFFGHETTLLMKSKLYKNNLFKEPANSELSKFDHKVLEKNISYIIAAPPR